MKYKLSKKELVFISVAICLIAFLFPWLFIEKGNILSVLSTAFTALGAVATVFTLFIALSLYQKFGLESRFKEKQTDKVFELINHLKGRVLYLKTSKFEYFLRFKVDDMKRLQKEPFYNYMKGKTIIIKRSGFEKFTKNILALQSSYWLPPEIESKLKFLDIAGYLSNVENANDEQYARLDFGSPKDEEYVATFPNQFSVEEFIKNKNELIMEIEKWLSKHSEIKVNLKMDIGEIELKEN